MKTDCDHDTIMDSNRNQIISGIRAANITVNSDTHWRSVSNSQYYEWQRNEGNQEINMTHELNKKQWMHTDQITESGNMKEGREGCAVEIQYQDKLLMIRWLDNFEDACPIKNYNWKFTRVLGISRCRDTRRAANLKRHLHTMRSLTADLTFIDRCSSTSAL